MGSTEERKRLYHAASVDKLKLFLEAFGAFVKEEGWHIVIM